MIFPTLFEILTLETQAEHARICRICVEHAASGIENNEARDFIGEVCAAMRPRLDGIWNDMCVALLEPVENEPAVTREDLPQ